MNISPTHSDRDVQTLPMSPRRDSLAHLDLPDFPVGIKSCFSEENEDEKSENGNEPDILQIAEQQDKLKASRDDLVIRMSVTSRPQILSNRETNKLNSPTNRRDSPNAKSYRSSYHFDKKAVTEVEAQATIEKQVQNENLLDADLSQGLDGDLDEHISAEPPRPVMPQPNTVHSISEEIKAKTEMSQSVRGVPEVNFTGSSRPIGPRSFPGGLPMMEGYLQKKSTNLFRMWLRRYYVLRNKKLYYYNNEVKDVKSGVLDFDLISVKLEAMEDKKIIKIVPAGGSRVFLLKAKTEEEGISWLQALEKHIKVSQGYVRSLCKVVKLKNFWKVDRISDTSFINQADTGDILLFKTKNMNANIQRAFTWSEYDHVALLLRFSSGDIVLFEATGKTGVGLCRWSTFMKSKWHLLYSKIVYRKLVVKRSEDIISGIESFVKFSVGKKYKVSAKKLLKKTEDREEENNENRTFFCSELVAACYKKIGLLPPDISAARYFPGAFAAEKKLQLRGGAKLNDECLVDFEI